MVDLYVGISVNLDMLLSEILPCSLCSIYTHISSKCSFLRKYIMGYDLGSCQGARRFDSGNGRPLPHAVSYLVGVGTRLMLAPIHWGKCGISATGRTYPSSVPHGRQPICPLWTHQSRPLWCWHWIWRGSGRLQAFCHLFTRLGLWVYFFPV